MKINRNSWHYKRADSFTYTPSKTLCLYFWEVVWGIVFWWVITPVFAVVVAVMVFGGLPGAAGSVFLDLFGYVKTDSKWVDAIWAIGTGYLFFLTLFALIGGFYYYRKVRSRQKLKFKKDENLFVSYLKAKKQKVCPIIEFTNGEDE